MRWGKEKFRKVDPPPDETMDRFMPDHSVVTAGFSALREVLADGTDSEQIPIFVYSEEDKPGNNSETIIRTANMLVRRHISPNTTITFAHQLTPQTIEDAVVEAGQSVNWQFVGAAQQKPDRIEISSIRPDPEKRNSTISTYTLYTREPIEQNTQERKRNFSFRRAFPKRRNIFTR